MLQDPEEACNFLVEISRSLTSDLNDQQVAETLLKIFNKILSLKKAALFLLNEEKARFDFYLGQQMSESDFKDIEMGIRAPFPERLRNLQQIVFKNDMKDLAEIKTPLFFHEAALHCCIPFSTGGKLTGFAFFGLDKSVTNFSPAEKQFLLLMGEQSAIAIENNRLAQALKKSKVLVRRTDRLKSLETIAGGMAHEIRNPLTSIKTFVELAGERRNDPDFFNTFSIVAREDVGRIERIIREVLDYSRYMEPVFTEEDINEVIQTTLPFMVVEANRKGAKFLTDYQKDISRVIVDRQQIKQVLLNLFINAIDALPPSDGMIKVQTSQFQKKENVWVRLQIEDNGTGISRENLENIFDPFFTTKHESKEREGTGLGLAIVHQIVQEHRGEVEVKSTPKVGTVFTVDLPSNPLLYERRKGRLNSALS